MSSHPENPFQPATSTVPVPDEPALTLTEFATLPNHATQAKAMIGLGATCVAGGLIAFVCLLFTRNVNQMTLHATTTLPTLLGIFSLARGLKMRRAPTYARIYREGIGVGRAPTERMIPWAKIANVSVDSNPWGESVILKDEQDKTLESFTSLQHQQEFVKRLRACLTALQQPGEQGFAAVQVASQAQEGRAKPTAIHRKRGRKRAILYSIFGLVMAFAGTFIISSGRWEARFAREMAANAIEGKGTITERKLAPNGVTKRLYVKVEGDQGGSETHNFEITDELYDQVAEGEEIPIRYVPSDPRIAELREGQVQEEDFLKTPLGSYLLGGVSLLMTLGIFAAAILAWKGYDIKFDEHHKGLVPIGD